MKSLNHKFIFWIQGILALSAAIFCFVTNNSLGFPDGHFTDLDKAMSVYYKITIPVCLFFTIVFVVVSLSNSLSRKIKITLIYSFIITSLLGIIILFYLSATLENGTGG